MKISSFFKKRGRFAEFGVSSQMARLVSVIRRNTTIVPETIFEIGANLADDGLFLAKEFGLPHTACYAFEPHPELFKEISKRYPELRAYQWAISEFNGSVDFHAVKVDEEGNHGISSLRRDTTRSHTLFDTIKVVSKTGASALKELGVESVDILKSMPRA